MAPRQFHFVVTDMNEKRCVQEVPYDSAFDFLPDAELKSVDSYKALSLYTFRCGCAVVRYIYIHDCRVMWCDRHRPRPRLSLV